MAWARGDEGIAKEEEEGEGREEVKKGAGQGAKLAQMSLRRVCAALVQRKLTFKG